MKYQTIGNTGFRVSRLCFGVLTIGPLQANRSLEEGADLLRRAWDAGVNFFDTAELYGTYPHLRRALQGKDSAVVATKSYAITREEMRDSVERARIELALDRIPIFLLHEQASAASFRGHRGAWEYLIEARERGLVGAIGLSTHTIEGVRVGMACPELDIIHPLFNMAGWGLRDGSAEEMAETIQTAAEMGKGIYAMKALAGGHLRQDAVSALRYVLDSPGVVSVAVGMQTDAELRHNLAVCLGESPEEMDQRALAIRPRRLHIESWCQACGKCLTHCPFGALQIREDRLQVDAEACMVCGYCSRACPEVALKVL